jgi:putative endonuclease
MTSGFTAVTNRNHSVLYIGLTNSLSRRTWEHREGTGTNCPAAYRCNKLIYYEYYSDVNEAIARESQLKKWSRAKKVALINRLNPSWLDLGTDVLQDRFVVRDFSTSPSASARNDK